MRRRSGVKEPVCRTKFIPRVGNWEYRAKRQAVTSYGDYPASPAGGAPRPTAKVPAPPDFRELVEESAERVRPSGFSACARVEPTGDEKALDSQGIARDWDDGAAAHESDTKIRQESADAAAASPGAREPQTGKSHEYFNAFAAAVQAFSNEVDMLEKEFASCIEEFGRLLSAQTDFVQLAEEQLAAVRLESVPMEVEPKAAVPPQQAGRLQKTDSAASCLKAYSVAERAKHQISCGGPPPKSQFLPGAQQPRVRSAFAAKKATSKWVAAARRKDQHLQA